MNIRRVTKWGALAAAAGMAMFLVCMAWWQGRQPVLKDPSKLMMAMQAYVRDMTGRGYPSPSSVPLWELIRLGYISADDVRAFDGMDVTFALAADERQPDQVLVRVRLPDGSVMAQMGDGSIRQLSR